MAHLTMIEDSFGYIVEYEHFCSDSCARHSKHYKGWYGAVELYAPEVCQTCGVELGYYEEDN